MKLAVLWHLQALSMNPFLCEKGVFVKTTKSLHTKDFLCTSGKNIDLKGEVGRKGVSLGRDDINKNGNLMQRFLSIRLNTMEFDQSFLEINYLNLIEGKFN